jgi:hypothetical protein
MSTSGSGESSGPLTSMGKAMGAVVAVEQKLSEMRQEPRPTNPTGRGLFLVEQGAGRAAAQFLCAIKIEI